MLSQKNKSRSKAINYRGQRVTRDIFKVQKDTLETKKSNDILKRTVQKETKEKSNDLEKDQTCDCVTDAKLGIMKIVLGLQSRIKMSFSDRNVNTGCPERVGLSDVDCNL
nr:unnamed protein product [Callosobruchus chinensis]